MLVFFINFIFSVQQSMPLYELYVRPKKNPLETYPFSFLPLCISDSVPGFYPKQSHKCKKSIVDVPSNHFLPPQTWCTTELDSDIRLFLNFLLSKHYQLVFCDDNYVTFSNLGPSDWLIFTHFNFVFLKTLEDFSLARVVPSNPINISEQFLGFTYETSFISTPRQPSEHSVFKAYVVGYFCVVIMILLGIHIPFSGKQPYTVLARYPNHSFSIVILCGSGAGLTAFLISYQIVSIFVPLHPFRYKSIVIPQMTSAFMTSIVTSILCGVWKLRDVASALYFAPIFFPSILILLVFTVQWISVSVNSCTTIPLNLIFYFIASVVLIMIPTNFVGIVITAILFKPKHHNSKKVKVSAFRLTKSRRDFLTISNSLLFFLWFPLFQILDDKVQYFKLFNKNNDPLPSILFPITATLASITAGIVSNGIKLENDGDWALFSFMSSAGSSAVIWTVSFINSAIVKGQKSTVQITLYPILLLLVCIAHALISGSLSVISSQLMITWAGIPVRKS